MPSPRPCPHPAHVLALAHAFAVDVAEAAEALRTVAVVRDDSPQLTPFLEALERILRHGLKRTQRQSAPTRPDPLLPPRPDPFDHPAP